MPTTSAERMRALRQRQADRGRVPLTVYVPAQAKEHVKKYAEDLTLTLEKLGFGGKATRSKSDDTSR